MNEAYQAQGSINQKLTNYKSKASMFNNQAIFRTGLVISEIPVTQARFSSVGRNYF